MAHSSHSSAGTPSVPDGLRPAYAPAPVWRTSLYSMLGFLPWLNGRPVPFFREGLLLSYTESSLVRFHFAPTSGLPSAPAGKIPPKPRFLKLPGLVLLILLSLPAGAGPRGLSAPVTRVLLVPLDDRPTSTQLPQRLGLIGNAEVTLPPRTLLGKFTTAGQPDRIIEWILGQPGGTFDIVIVALDMLAYGGLVGSRMHRVESAEALRRVEFLRTLKQHMPQAKLYAHNVIMRLAPTPGDTNEPYRTRLERWAELSAGSDARDRQATAALEREIPGPVLADYQMTRRRNLLTNLKALELVREGVIEYLLLSQDDAKPQGVHMADREKLLTEIRDKNLERKVAVQPGADEVSMLLLARALAQLHGYRPAIRPVYSSDSVRLATMPFEDGPLHRTVSQHIRAAGGWEEVAGERAGAIFFVFASRREAGRAESFAGEIEAAVEKGNRIIVADIDPRGDVQGGDPGFVDALHRRGLFPGLSGYAAWNTAGNAIGTALAQGVVFTLAQEKLAKEPELAPRLLAAQHWFTLHRVLDDFYFHTLVRAETNGYLHQQKKSSLIMDDEKAQRAEAFGRKRLQRCFRAFTQQYFRGVAHHSTSVLLSCRASDFRFSLPWNRMFEASLDFRVHCGSP